MRKSKLKFADDSKYIADMLQGASPSVTKQQIKDIPRLGKINRKRENAMKYTVIELCIPEIFGSYFFKLTTLQLASYL